MKMYSTLALIVVFIVFALPYMASAAIWEVPDDYATIQMAIDDPVLVDGDVIAVRSGNYAGALVNKRVEIIGKGQVIIDSGPVHGSGLIQGFRLLTGSDGSTFSHLTINTDLAIMNGEGADGVTVTQCSFNDTVQAVSNWRGSSWEITHNTITNLRTRCGGGIGILVGDYSGGIVTDNVVSHNTIRGTLHVSNGDCGGYNGTGIVLFADFRWGSPGAESIEYNRVVKNKVSLVSDTPTTVNVAGIELTEARDDNGSYAPVIVSNGIGFNDLCGTVLQLVLTPIGLDNPTNDISRNLGENRGHGLHPGVFRAE